MNTRRYLAVGAALVLCLAVLPAGAQDAMGPKGVKTRGLVDSLGPFSKTVRATVTITGATVELEPAGQTGRERFAVPTLIYVVEGVLTTDYEAGPVGTKGIQYHTAGQWLLDEGGWWHNHMNRSDKPVKYLRVHVGYPGSKTVEQAEPE